MMRRLYVQIYVAFLGIALLFGVLVSVAWVLIPTPPQDRRLLDSIGVLLSTFLPGPERPVAELQTAVERLGRLLPAHFTVRQADGILLAAVGNPFPAPSPGRTHSGWMHVRGRGPTLALELPDGRWVIVRWQHHHTGWFVALALLAVAIALGAYPVARRMTRRLERLQQRVEALGAGDLTARVKVEGDDEVGHLARSFNRAADRIERLVNAQRTMLAGASHELRSPLARIRMAVQLLSDEARPEIRTRLAQDIAELGALIGELLLASRLDALEHLERLEEVDLLALLA